MSFILGVGSAYAVNYSQDEAINVTVYEKMPLPCCFAAAAQQCFWRAMNSEIRSTETITPTVRIMKFRGLTGHCLRQTVICSSMSAV